MLPANIPSPSEGVWHIGDFPIRGYALCIILGIVAAIWIAERRWKARGGTYGEVQDVAIWAVPFGLVGGRLYHVMTDPNCYFDRSACEGDGGVFKGFWGAFEVWNGGLGIWGAVALGALGAWIGCRRKGIRFSTFADTVAPALLVAQAIGRWGNWFNQELYGRATDLPWGLEISEDNWQCQVHGVPASGSSCLSANGGPYDLGVTFHPTFLYECLWNLAGFALLLWLERRFRLGFGQVMAAYVMIYTAGRFWIEYLRVDNVQLAHVLGLRFNDWTSIVCFVGGAAYLWWSRRRHRGAEPSPYRRDPSAHEADEDGVAGVTSESTSE